MYNSVPLPRDSVIDVVCDAINGMGPPDPHRRGFMTRERAAATLDAFKQAGKRPIAPIDLAEAPLRKNVTMAAGLAYYDLRAPALNIFPTVTPIRNSVRRIQTQFPGDAYYFKTVNSTTGSGPAAIGWVPEGRRAASMSYSTSSTTLNFATLGEEDSVTEEALIAADGFEDEAALIQLRTMLRLFAKQEMALLGGNRSLPIGVPTAPTVTATGSLGTLGTATYSVIVVGLTAEGYANSSLAGGVSQALNITGNDGQTFVLNMGSGNKSLNATQSLTSGQNLTATTPVLPGASAYAWYVGAAGAETLQAITGANSATFSAPLTAGAQSASAITANCSTNTALAYDGLLTWGLKSGSGAYVNTLASGAGLTVGNDGAIAEVDNMFKTMWLSNFLSPTVLYASTSGVRAMANIAVTSSTAPLLGDASVDVSVTPQGVIAWLFNPYNADGGCKVKVAAHPYMPPGTVLGWAERLPIWYTTNALPSPAIVSARMDTYMEVWPRVQRTIYFGVYSQEVLAVHTPFAIGIINNITGA